MLLPSTFTLLLLAGGVAGCIDEDEPPELTDLELEFDEVEPWGPAAVDHLGLNWIADESGDVLVIDDGGQIVDRYELDGVGGVEDIEVTETHLYVLTMDGAEPVIARAGRNDVAPSAWETFSIPADNLNLNEVTGLRKDDEGIVSLELAFGREHLPLFAAGGILDIAAAPLAQLEPVTDIIFNVSGYLPANSKYVPVGPTRLLDTRLNGQQYVGPLGNTQVVEVTLAGKAGLPQANAIGAVVLNVTVVPQKAGYLTAYPDATIPGTSNINFAPNEHTAGLVIIAPGPDGKISLRHSTVHGFSSHVIVDVFGYFPPAADINMIQPQRVFDSREVQYGPKWAAEETRDVQIGGVSGIPLQGVGAVIANVTAVSPAGHGSATVYTAGTPKPNGSPCLGAHGFNLNYTGTTRANLVIIPLSAAGKATIHTSQSAHYIVDVLGWFGQGVDFEPIEPLCLVDTSYIVVAPLDHLASRDINVIGATIPDGALAIFGNLTAIYPTGRGFLQVYPVPANPNAVPITSNLNFNADKTVSNAVLTAVSPEGEFRVTANYY